ncbi:MAG: hypothetical protein ABIW80_00655 [Lapillicoccus sp.]
MSWRLRDQPVWRARVIRAVVGYVVLMLALVLLGVSPSPVLVAALVVAGTIVMAFFSDRFSESHGEAWVTPGQSTLGLGRGGDHRTVALSRRLADPGRDPQQRAHLAADLQRQLAAVLADRVARERGVDLLAHPDRAYDVLPSDLADLVAQPPDPRLVDAAYLGAVLDRIEAS